MSCTVIASKTTSINATISTEEMILYRCPSPPSAMSASMKELSATRERRLFLSSFAAQCGQASHLHLSTFMKNGVATSRAQVGHLAMENTPFADVLNVPCLFRCVNGTGQHCSH